METLRMILSKLSLNMTKSMNSNLIPSMLKRYIKGLRKKKFITFMSYKKVFGKKQQLSFLIQKEHLLLVFQKQVIFLSKS